MKRFILFAATGSVALGLVLFLMPAQAQFTVGYVSPVDVFGTPLRDGDLIGASGYSDPDIYIINMSGFAQYDTAGDFRSYNGAKRLFLNPTIFNFYGHLGGFGNVRQVTPLVRDSFLTSGFFRNCETNREEVWAVETTGEDSGVFHHVQVSGPQAVSEDPHFFKKVFCINSNEERWYAKSISPYRRLADVPRYERDRPIPSPSTCAPIPDCAQYGANPACALAPTGPDGRPWCPPRTSDGCHIGGCSGQICSDTPNAVSTCEYQSHYACFRDAQCERQDDGQCGWTRDDAFNLCMVEHGGLF